MTGRWRGSQSWKWIAQAGTFDEVSNRLCVTLNAHIAFSIFGSHLFSSSLFRLQLHLFLERSPFVKSGFARHIPDYTLCRCYLLVSEQAPRSSSSSSGLLMKMVFFRSNSQRRIIAKIQVSTRNICPRKGMAPCNVMCSMLLNLISLV